jgi:hypothetical protein
VQDYHLQVDGGLAVVDAGDAFLVVTAEDPGDWLVPFEKGGGFPAQEWAENMIRVYNRRRAVLSRTPPTTPGKRPTS